MYENDHLVSSCLWNMPNLTSSDLFPQESSSGCPAASTLQDAAKEARNEWNDATQRCSTEDLQDGQELSRPCGDVVTTDMDFLYLIIVGPMSSPIMEE